MSKAPYKLPLSLVLTTHLLPSFPIFPRCHKSLPESAATCPACPAHADYKVVANQVVGMQGHSLSSEREQLSTGQPGLRQGVPRAAGPRQISWPRTFPHGACPGGRPVAHPVGRHSDRRATLAGSEGPRILAGAQAQLRVRHSFANSSVSHGEEAGTIGAEMGVENELVVAPLLPSAEPSSPCMYAA